MRHGRRHPSREGLDERQAGFNALGLASRILGGLGGVAFHVACPKATTMPELRPIAQRRASAPSEPYKRLKIQLLIRYCANRHGGFCVLKSFTISQIIGVLR